MITKSKILIVGLLFAVFTTQAEEFLRFEGSEGLPGSGKHVVLISGDEEYRTEESTPMLAKILNKRFGYTTSVLFAINPDGGFIDNQFQKNIPGMSEIATADLVIIGTRFRDLPEEQLQPLAEHLNKGKSVIGIRTATHAFRGKNTTGGINWSSFGRDILGEGWVSHYGKHKVQGARSIVHEKNWRHQVLRGVETIFAESDVYEVKAENVNDENATILLNAVVTHSLDPASPTVPGLVPQPVAWVRKYKTPEGLREGRSFCTTFGSSCDFDDENLRRLLINAAFFLTNVDVPEKTDVSYIDPFEASAYTNHRTSDYYKELNLKPADYGYGSSPETGPSLEKLIQEGIEKAGPLPSTNAAAGLPGPAIKSTVTTVEMQRESGERPVFNQPNPVSTPEEIPGLPIVPGKGETIVFIGNSLAERMEHFGYFETLLHEQFPDKEITFRNMGFPGHTPAFRPEAGQPNPWAFPGAEKFRPEINEHFGKGHYPMPDEWLTIIEADTIVAFFGFNESFDGRYGVENFKAELGAFVDHTLSRSYSGKETPPKLVLVTPVAMEQLPQFHLPDAEERNELLSLYADAVTSVAKEKGIPAIDLFSPTSKRFEEAADSGLTINGVHLSGEGYKEIAPILVKELFGKEATVDADGGLLRQAIYDKSWFWRNDYRMLNGVHAYGGRWTPYGNFNYPEEIEKIRQMTVLRDENIWAIAQGKSDSLEVDDSNTRPLTQVETNYQVSEKNGSPDFMMEKEALEKFTLPEGYEVSVFATEQEFPNLGNPAQMRFDNEGRLWVSTVKSYPHYKPGGPMPNDMLLIYEDTDGDGRADKETVFADKLHIPIGFELAPEGVYISEEPYLTLHKDTDGDGKADTKEYLLDGFDPHDTHHAISAFDVDHGGGIFMCEGRFLHSQVETPWGPERMADGGAWRFDPKSWKVERVFQSDVSNPWGVAHDDYGQSFLNDASGGNQYWMLGYSMKVPHAFEIPKVAKFNYEHHTRPSSGSEFIYSSHFPDEVQGDYIYCNTIGFLGIKQYNTVEDGVEIKGKHRQDLIVSTDGNFRPADLELGPDGALYFIDWHNTLIGHMQHSARDPLRNSDFGRVYRITYPSRPLVEAPEIAGADLATLFENLKLPEINARKRSHREMRGRDASEVIAAAEAFAADNADDGRLVLESLWATWGQQQPSTDLIEQCLASEDHRVRAGAIRVVRHCLHLLDDSKSFLMKAAVDSHPRVRLEALSAATWLEGSDGAKILLTVATQPTDKWIRNALNSGMLLLKEEVDSLFAEGTIKKEDITDGVEPLLASKLQGATKPKNYVTKEVWSKADKETKRVLDLGLLILHEEGSCSTCHLETGLGVENIYPPITGSPWVTGNKERLIKLVLHGLWGEIEVLGKTYSPDKGVPPMTAVGAMFNDAEVAAVLSYVRNSWGNQASMVTPEEVKAVRAATKDQTQFYSPEQLLKEHPLEE